MGVDAVRGAMMDRVEGATKGGCEARRNRQAKGSFLKEERRCPVRRIDLDAAEILIAIRDRYDQSAIPPRSAHTLARHAPPVPTRGLERPAQKRPWTPSKCSG